MPFAASNHPPRCSRHPRRWCPGECQYILAWPGCMHDEVAAGRWERFPAPATPSPSPRAPCGECHLRDGETCDICGAVQPIAAAQSRQKPTGARSVTR